jgi:hypothetical protein
MAEVSLAQGGAAFSGSPRAVVLAAGTLDPMPKELVRSMNKQVLLRARTLISHARVRLRCLQYMIACSQRQQHIPVHIFRSCCRTSRRTACWRPLYHP